MRSISEKFKHICMVCSTFFFTMFWRIIAFADVSGEDITSTVEESESVKQANLAAQQLMQLLTNSHETGLLDIVSKAGGLFVAIGIGQMVLSTMNEDATQKVRATTVILAGVFLIFIKVTLSTLFTPAPE